MAEQAVLKKRPDMVTVIGIYQFVSAALFLLGALAVGIGLVAVVLSAVGEDLIIGSSILGVIIAVLVVIAIVHVVVGWGLLAQKNWARWTAVVLAALGLFNVPVGTVIGGLIIWYLLTPEAKEAFEAEV
ncbi:MAG: hypothetical protein GXY76_10155 [Chloroflexi bacterium]|nr:hypothetical protein [Chloroflexota bacterium]